MEEVEPVSVEHHRSGLKDVDESFVARDWPAVVLSALRAIADERLHRAENASREHQDARAVQSVANFSDVGRKHAVAAAAAMNDGDHGDEAGLGTRLQEQSNSHQSAS